MSTGFYPIIDTPVPEEGFLINQKKLESFFEKIDNSNYWFNLASDGSFRPNNIGEYETLAKTDLIALKDLEIHVVYDFITKTSDDVSLTIGLNDVLKNVGGTLKGTTETYFLPKGEKITLKYSKLVTSVVDNERVRFTIYAKPQASSMKFITGVKNAHVLENKRANNLIDNGELYYSLRGWSTPKNCKVNFLIDNDGSRFTRITATTDIIESDPALLAQDFLSPVIANYDLQHTLWISAKVRVFSATPKSSVFFSGVNKSSINAEDEISGVITGKEWQTDYIYISTDARPAISSTFNDVFFGFFYAAEGDYFDIRDVFVCDLTELYGLNVDPTRTIPNVEWCLNNLVGCPKGKKLDNTPMVAKKVNEIYFIDNERKPQIMSQFPPSGLENFVYTKEGNYYYISGLANDTASTVRVPNSSYVAINSISSVRNSTHTKHLVIPDKVKISNSIANGFDNSRLQTIEFNSSNIINMSGAFRNCRNLTGTPVCGDNVVNFYAAYINCNNITGQPIFGDRVEDARFAYSGCRNLSLPAVISGNVNLVNGCFRNCSFPSGNFYFYSSNIEGCSEFFTKIKKSNERHNFYYLAETITAKTLQNGSEDYSILGNSITYTDVMDGVYANGKLKIGCRYNTSYNIYLYPVNTIEDLDAIRKKNGD